VQKTRIKITAGGSAQERNDQITTNWKDPQNLSEDCLACSNQEMVICDKCSAISCCTNGQPWQCPSCPQSSPALSTVPHPVITAAKPNQQRLAGKNAAAALPNPVKRLK